MKKLAAKLFKSLLVAAGVAVILLAVAVGGARLMFAQLPGYGEEVSAWIAEEVGLDVGFQRIDVRFNLRGPEISFRRATVAAPQAEAPFLRARRASVTIDPWALATRREGFVSSLVLEGTRLVLVRDERGRVELQGAPILTHSDRLLSKLPERVQLGVADTTVVYRDRRAGVVWEFADVEVVLARAPGRVSLDATARPPAELGADLRLAVEAGSGEQGTGLDRWQLDLVARQADLGAVSPLLGPTPLPAVVGRGDVSLSVTAGDGGVEHARASLGLRDFALPELAAGPEWRYERLALDAEWTRDTARAWTLRLDEVALERSGAAWAAGGESVLRHARLAGGGRRIELTSDFVRLEDLRPFLLLLPPSDGVRRWLEADVRGDLRGLDLRLVQRNDTLDYDVTGRFRGLGVEASARLPGLDGLTGEIRADSRSGRVRLASAAAELEWPAYARGPLEITDLQGVVVWRAGRSGLRVVSDGLGFSALGGEGRSSLELTFPAGGGSPRVDLEAALSRAEITAAKRVLPVRIIPDPVVEWLDTALDGGTARDVELELYGPLSAFPFDAGEGQFRVAGDVADAELEFVEGWPRAVDVEGRVEFVNAGFAARGAGRVLGNVTRELAVGIDDLREPVLRVDTVTDGPLADVLAFLKGAPLIARELGPELERLRVHAGSGRVELDLDLPLLDFGAYALSAGLDLAGGDVSVDGFAPHATEVTGRLELDDADVTADSIEAVFLDGPVSIDVVNPDVPGYRSLLDVDGESTIEAVRRQFDLPFAERVGGQTRWQAQLWIPASPAAAPRAPFRVRVASNLSGIALRLPPPLAKPPAEPTSLNLEFEFAEDGLAVGGNLGASRRFRLRFDRRGESFGLAEGAVRFGGEPPKLPGEQGITLAGSLPRLDLSGWLALAAEADSDAPAGLLLGADLELAELNAFGQQLGTSALEVTRAPERWRIAVESEAVAGTIEVPRTAPARAQISAEMRRLYLADGDVAPGVDTLDPRVLPGITLHADELAFGTRELGEVDLEVRPDPLGLRLVSFASRNGEMHVDASGSWLTGVEGARTRLAVNLSSTRVSSTLQKLGFDPVIEGELADVTASVEWPGPPTTDWMGRVDGDVAVRVETGSMLDIEPGAGRVVGLMSILALPRRLALDFRDVFNKGFVFDEITGDFLLIDGNAYTDNLKLTGPAAEIGVAGRTGLADRDYEQQAVVTAEPGNMLPTVGGLIGGPGVGAALLIFTRIFKEPLKGIGRAVYCITGSWDDPQVERLTADEIEQGELCAALPPEGAAARAGVEPIDP